MADRPFSETFKNNTAHLGLDKMFYDDRPLTHQLKTSRVGKTRIVRTPRKPSSESDQ